MPFDEQQFVEYVQEAKGRPAIELIWDIETKGVDLKHLNKCTERALPPMTKQPENPLVNINECFQLFGQEEQLEATDTWFCSNCELQVQAFKKLELYLIPEVLIIHLKRFKTNGYHREKLVTKVDFPITGLNLSDYVIGPNTQQYDLYAVSNHFGSLGGGHYTSYCLHPEKKEWFEYNDSKVTKVKAEEIISPHAYILFYKRRQPS